MVDRWPGFHCVGAYLRAEEALAAVPALTVRAAIVDLQLPRISGAGFIRKLKELHPSCDILVHSIETRELRVLEALEAGATGYLIKGAPPRDLFNAFRDILNGGSPMSPSIARLVLRRFQSQAAHLPQAAPPELTPRQMEVLKLIARGYTNDETARELSLTTNTVKTHIRHMYGALQIRSRAEIAAWWHARRGGGPGKPRPNG
jgi:DNA-binding NarL/FixJ family response regulator